MIINWKTDTKPFSRISSFISFSFFYIVLFCFKSIYFIYLFLAALGLPCCTRAFSSCSEWGLLFAAVPGLLIAVASLCCGARALGVQASVVVACGLSSWGLQSLERRLSSCGAQAYLLRGMWDLPGPGLEPMSPALAGRFLTTEPPGKPFSFISKILFDHWKKGWSFPFVSFGMFTVIQRRRESIALRGFSFFSSTWKTSFFHLHSWLQALEKVAKDQEREKNDYWLIFRVAGSG